MAKGAANARRYFLNQQFSCLGTHKGSCSVVVCVRKKSPSRSEGRGFEVDRKSSRPIRRSASSQSGNLVGQENQGWGIRRTTAGLPAMFIARNTGSFHGLLAGKPSAAELEW